MTGLVHSRIRPFFLGLALAFSAAAPSFSNEQKTEARFTVALGSLTLGVFWLDGTASGREYAAKAGFRSTGLVGQFANVHVGMASKGRRSGARFMPESYSEEVVLRRQSEAFQMTYTRGVPKISGAKADRDVATPVDPATQSDTLDPLTATFALLRDQPLEGLCQIDRFMFDGARRTRVVMTNLSKNGDDLICSGYFQRLEGYSARDLRRSGRVSVTVRYRPIDGVAVARDARFRSLRGQLRLTRR